VGSWQVEENETGREREREGDAVSDHDMKRTAPAAPPACSNQNDGSGGRRGSFINSSHRKMFPSSTGSFRAVLLLTPTFERTIYPLRLRTPSPPAFSSILVPHLSTNPPLVPLLFARTEAQCVRANRRRENLSCRAMSAIDLRSLRQRTDPQLLRAMSEQAEGGRRIRPGTGG
jgi:hypothetical protein